jgi:hypothetical protein
MMDLALFLGTLVGILILGISLTICAFKRKAQLKKYRAWFNTAKEQKFQDWALRRRQSLYPDQEDIERAEEDEEHNEDASSRRGSVLSRRLSKAIPKIYIRVQNKWKFTSTNLEDCPFPHLKNKYNRRVKELDRYLRIKAKDPTATAKLVPKPLHFKKPKAHTRAEASSDGSGKSTISVITRNVTENLIIAVNQEEYNRQLPFFPQPKAPGSPQPKAPSPEPKAPSPQPKAPTPEPKAPSPQPKAPTPQLGPPKRYTRY